MAEKKKILYIVEAMGGGAFSNYSFQCTFPSGLETWSSRLFFSEYSWTGHTSSLSCSKSENLEVYWNCY